MSDEEIERRNAASAVNYATEVTRLGADGYAQDPLEPDAFRGASGERVVVVFGGGELYRLA